MQFPLPVISSVILLSIMFLILWRAYSKNFSSLGSWLLFFAGSALFFTFLFFAGTWAFLSMHLRWVFLVIYIVGVIYSFSKHKRRNFKSPQILSVWFAVSRVFIILIAGFLVFMYVDSGTHNGKTVPLTFPFKNGTFYMMQGGSNRLSNLFHSFFSKEGYGYAMDIAALNKWGNRAKSIYSQNLEDYEIYNDTIYSACDGQVLTIIDGVPDNPPGTINTLQIHGNHMIIQSNGYRLFMAHLKKDKIFVKEGQQVERGQPLALLGNSGFTAEPHIHLNVLAGYEAGNVYSGYSVPATFNGKFYTLNDIIIN